MKTPTSDEDCSHKPKKKGAEETEFESFSGPIRHGAVSGSPIETATLRGELPPDLNGPFSPVQEPAVVRGGAVLTFGGEMSAGAKPPEA